MAKVLKEETRLDTAVRELAELRDRLAKAEHNQAKYKEELANLWEQRLMPNAVKNADGQKRTIELRALISDEAAVIDSLRGKIQERQATVEALTREQQKEDAGVACASLHAEFRRWVRALDVVAIERWLAESSKVRQLYFHANGFSEQISEAMAAGAADLLARIKVLQTL